MTIGVPVVLWAPTGFDILKPRIEPARGAVFGVDVKEHLRPVPQRRGAMEAREERASNALAATARGHRNRKEFNFARDDAAQREAVARGLKDRARRVEKIGKLRLGKGPWHGKDPRMKNRQILWCHDRIAGGRSLGGAASAARR